MFYNWKGGLEVSIDTDFELSLEKEELGHIVQVLIFMADISHEDSSSDIESELGGNGIFIEVCSKHLDEERLQALQRALEIYIYNRYLV